MAQSNPQSEPSWEECIELLERLPSMSVPERVEAIALLVRNSSPGIRGRALRMGAAALSDDVLTSYLRNDDDGVLRNAGLEMLKMRGNRGFSLAIHLLKDPDYDVALQAVLILDHLKDPRALEALRGQLRHEDINVVQAVIVAIGHLGDARTIPDLLPYLEGESWLQVAAVEALGDIRSPVAVPHLAQLLTDLMVGPMAAEALARIGGEEAYRFLAEHWLRFRQELDTETTLGLLAHVLEGLPKFPEEAEGLRPALAQQLQGESASIRLPAARCLLALGPGSEDRAALEQLVDQQLDPLLLPACLSGRRDLIARLLLSPDQRRAWGFLLCARFPEHIPTEELVTALSRPMEPEWLELLVRTLSKVESRRVASALLDLYRSLGSGERSALAPVLTAHGSHLRTLLSERDDLQTKTRLVLSVLLEERVETAAAEIQQLPEEDRLEVLAQITDRSALTRLLPWRQWIELSPDRYGPIAAEVAVHGGPRDLRPQLRSLLEQFPGPELVRAMGELGDSESVPTLVALLQGGDGALDLIVLESLGRIGGPQVRRTLRDVAEGSGDAKRARIAYRALSLCATDEDDAFFRDAADHGDWYVRLACAEVLGRFQRPENLSVLAQLASDPVSIVAQRAMALLESEGVGK
ncbi:MAG: HEAT repeat domain-containing protein [Acidobacteriota bacterium]